MLKKLILLISLIILCQSFCGPRTCLSCNQDNEDVCDACYINSSKAAGSQICKCDEGYYVSQSNPLVCEKLDNTVDLQVKCMSLLTDYAGNANLKLVPSSKILNNAVHYFTASIMGAPLDPELAKCPFKVIPKFYQEYNGQVIEKEVSVNSSLSILDSKQNYMQYTITISQTELEAIQFKEDVTNDYNVINFFVIMDIQIYDITYITTNHNAAVMYKKGISLDLGSFIVDKKNLNAKCVCTNTYEIKSEVKLFLDMQLKKPFTAPYSFPIGVEFYVLVTNSASRKMAIKSVIQSDANKKTIPLTSFSKVVRDNAGELAFSVKFLQPGKGMGIQVEVDLLTNTQRFLSHRLLATDDLTENAAEKNSGGYVTDINVCESADGCPSMFSYIQQFINVLIIIALALII